MIDGSTKHGKISLVNGAGHGRLVLELYLKVNTQACLKSAAPVRYQQDSDKPTSMMFPTLRQQIVSRSLPQRLQRIQLLVEPLHSQANSRFYDLGQPFRTMARSIHGWPGTRNGPASVHGLDPTDHPRQIFGDRSNCRAARRRTAESWPLSFRGWTPGSTYQRNP